MKWGELVNNYTVLHCHTELSSATTNIDSVTKYEDYIKYAKELGMKAIAITEHGNILSWLKKKECCEKNGIKYIHGIEAYLTETIDEKIRDNYHCCLYAKNFEGVKELNVLISKSYNRKDNHFYYTPRILIDDLLNTSDNIIIASACLGGVFSKGTDKVKQRFIEFFIKNKHRCFLEIQHHNVHAQREYNKYLYQLSQICGLQLVANTDTHCLNEKHVRGRNILQKAKNIHFDNEDGWDLTFKSYDELIQSYEIQGSLPMEVVLQAIENTNKIADMIEEFTLDRSYKYPKLYANSEDVLKQKINEGVLRTGINKLPNYQSEYLPRIYHELETYKHNGAIDFLLLDENIKTWARNNNIFPGYSRGSCSGSLICYLLGITEVDSILHKMNFERFMNLERVSLADIDTDWSPNQRDLVKEYIYSMKGLYCADIITFNTVALKGSIRDVGRALGISLDIVDDICKNITDDNIDSYREQYQELFDYVDIINGTVVSIGTHPCFLGDELVLTENGYKEIKDIGVGDKVLTHTGIYKEVAEIMNKETDDVYEIVPSGTLPIKTTSNHPFYVRKRIDKRLRKYKDGIDTTTRTYLPPTWIELKDLNKGDMIGIPINTNSFNIKNEFDLPYINEDLWWIIGRYIGDGWITEMNRVDKRTDRHYTEKYLVICCSKKNDEKYEITTVLDRLGFKYSIQERKTVYRIYIRNIQLLEYLKKFGKYANNKFIPNEVLDLPIHLLQSFIEGYLSADGYENNGNYSFKTVSKKLALGMINCIAKVYHRHCGVSIIKAKDEYIEGRLVHSKEKYEVRFTKDIRKGERSFYENGYIWMPYRSINKLNNEIQTVYNLSVYDDNSYTVNNIAVHNCGLVCSPMPLDENMGLLTLATCENPVTMLNMKEIDSLNYVKLDVLGLDNIQIINETCALAGIDRLTPQNIDDNDLDVWQSIKEETLGIFQWDGSGSYYIKDLLSDETIKRIKKVYPDFRYIDLMSCGNGAIRPAGESYREELAQGIFRDNGHQALNDLLAPTLGYLVYQEQILSFLHEFCGYTMGEADIVRRGFAKKTGTEQFIPQIKSGFIKTMKEKYDVSEEESEHIVESFIRVIEDASSYLFSLNHSLPYSYIGYICGYLRYYYPLEFITTLLNINKDNADKTTKALEYANKHDIKIKPPKFRYSKAEYFMDKETNSIYKGIESIKYLNSEVAESLYSLKDNQYNSFLDLLIDIHEKGIKINSRQMSILISIDFFSEFGKSQKLFDIVEIFDTIYIKQQNSKQGLVTFNKKKEMKYSTDIISKFAEKETDNQIKVAKAYELCNYLIDNEIKDFEMPSVDKVITYFSTMGTCDYIFEDYMSSICIVVDIITKYKVKRALLYNIASGKTIEVRIGEGIYELQQFKQYDVVNILHLFQKPKKKQVEVEVEDKNGNVSIKKKWQPTGEFELYVDEYHWLDSDEVEELNRQEREYRESLM